MGRPRKVVKKENPRKTCIKCKKDKPITQFYNSNSPMFEDKVPICKDCIRSLIDYNNMDTIYTLLQQMDIMFDPFYWSKALESPKETLGNYITMLNSLPQFRGRTWRDSVFTSPAEASIGNMDTTKPIINLARSEFIVTDELIDKWGVGYTADEYRTFERKYQLLKNNYQEKTAMHTEALLTYIRYRVKEEIATSEGRIKDAKDWGALAQQAATNAKINPSQLSKSDLSDGLDTFGQLVRTVEQAIDIIPILPKFKERPQDKVDFTIWCYVNYIRDLKGLPPADYKDIYEFYELRKKEYEDRYSHQEEDDDGDDE